MRKLLTHPRTIVALVFLAVILFVASRGLPDGQLHVWFLDVGQGDAILIQTPDGRQILVDGGPSPSALLDQLGEVLPFWDRSLDLVVLTHPDSDHLSGLIPMFDRYKVATVLDAVGPGYNAAESWFAVTSATHVTRQNVIRGMRLNSGGLGLTVLSPLEPGTEMEGSNNGSVVLRLDYGAVSVLLTGDAEAEVEQAMLAGGLPLRADVLKVGHHGSSESTSDEFLAAVQPRLAIISVGADNRFGHPAPELLKRLAGTQVLRTDERGRIELVSDGKKWTVYAER